MKHTIKWSLAALIISCSFNALAAKIVYWDDAESFERLVSSENKTDFARLSVYYQPQENKMFCGVASAAMVLNALRVDRTPEQIPLDSSQFFTLESGYLPNGGGNVEHSDKSYVSWSPLFHRYTQNTVLIHSPKSRIEILGKPAKGSQFNDYGLQLSQFVDLVKSNGAKVVSYELQNIDDIDTIKANMVTALSQPEHYLVVNYARKGVEQKGGGHYAPVAAYDGDSDSFLILDPNNADYLWHWVDATSMIKAMNTIDVDRYRGYAIISD
ncbi:phytochelatin synthase family protein [Vibrio coralliilyticus]|uniref:phytochelatin synthase family protein n=1 Tax=Vibrio coralliilyticus TaxID=190893 RepID=UPI0005127F24|nr:phytochelatin synthase family protein [Vibrio coralliilyticus]AIU66688.1 phytochelatin synthase [Vibrio coralliilyticus]